MDRLLGSALALLALAGCAASTEASSTTEQMATTDAPARTLAQGWVDAQWANAISVALIHDGQIETYGVGHRDDTSSAAPDADTVFEIGSLSKVFTSLLLAEAVTRGEVTLDQPIQELVPAEIESPTRDGQGITLRNLSTHASGLPRLPGTLATPSVDLTDPYATYDATKLFSDLQSSTLATKPGTTYLYSNFGAGLLGELLATKAGKTYGDLLAERIATPLGLSRTGLVYPASNFAQGHDGEGNAVRGWSWNALSGAGGVRSSVADVASFAAHFLAADSDAVRLTTQVQADLEANAPTGAHAHQKMGLAWHFSGDSVVWHNGQTGGCHSFVALDLSHHQGVVMLANQSDPSLSGFDTLGAQLLQVLRGQTPTAPAPVVDVPAETLRSYEGVYQLSPAFQISVTNDKGRTYVQATNQPRFRVYATSAAHFELHAVAASIDFVKDDSGAVSSLVLHQNGDQTAAKIR